MPMVLLHRCLFLGFWAIQKEENSQGDVRAWSHFSNFSMAKIWNKSWNLFSHLGMPTDFCSAMSCLTSLCFASHSLPLTWKSLHHFHHLESLEGRSRDRVAPKNCQIVTVSEVLFPKKRGFRAILKIIVGLEQWWASVLLTWWHRGPHDRYLPKWK